MYKKIIQKEVIIYRKTSRAEESYSGDYEQAEVFMRQAVEITEKEKLTTCHILYFLMQKSFLNKEK